MARKIKYGKIAIVIFLTALIWVWADLAQHKDFSIPSVTIRVAKSVNAGLLVNFKDESPASFVSIDNVVLRGPASKIAEVERMRNKGLLDLEFFLVPQAEGIIEPGDHLLDVLNFLKHKKLIEELGLTIKSCEPKTLVVEAVKLVEKPLNVECIDENGLPLITESIEPSRVEAFTPLDQTLTAKVQLTSSEREQARVSAITKTPYIELPGGQIRNAATPVKIKMPPAENMLRDYTITTATLGFSLSENLQGQYKVVLLNPTDMATVSIKATLAAKQAYEQQPFQMILYILDDDRMATAELRRIVVFNFPKEHALEDEIRQNQEPPTARFRLTPITSSESGIEE